MTKNKNSLIKYKFQYGGRCSSEFGIKIKNWNYLNIPERNIEEIEIPGKNGSLFIDQGTYKNRIIDIECYIDMRGKDKTRMASELTKWLLQDCQYKTLVFSDNDDYSYDAICINKIDFSELITDYFEFIISFSAKPFINKTNASQEITISDANGINFYNDSVVEAEPIWEIETNMEGKTSYLIINNKRYQLYNHKLCTMKIDCELMNITKNPNTVFETNYNEVLTNAEFPNLEVGDNKIMWEGNIKQIKLIPNLKYL